jgi:hypothetical protein
MGAIKQSLRHLNCGMNAYSTELHDGSGIGIFRIVFVRRQDFVACSACLT